MGKIKFKRMLLIAAVILMVFSQLTGCGKEQDAKKDQKATNEYSTVQKEPDVIKLPLPSSVIGVSIYDIAEELGFPKEENLKFEFVGAVDPGQLVASVVAGKIDVGGAHINRTIAGISAGAKIKAVVAQTVTTKEIPHMTYITEAGSPINSAADLAGKRLGIYAFGGCNEYIPYGYMLKNGIDAPKGKFKIVVAPESKLEQALKQKEVDIIGLHDSPSNILKRGNYKVVFSDYDVWEEIGGGTPLYFSQKFIKEKPDVVRRFVKVIAKTNSWVNKNPQKAVEITAKKYKVNPEILRSNIYVEDGVIKDETVTVWIDLLKKFGEIKSDIKPSDIYTNEFNENAKK
ncbi:MAG TPA: ABC transporter substrate-binding protein [Clostridia bacterium]